MFVLISLCVNAQIEDRLSENGCTRFFWRYIIGVACVLNFHVLQGKPPDWQDFVGIITLLFINSTISFIEENNAGNAAAALMARLAPKAKVLAMKRSLVFLYNCIVW